MNFYLVQVVVNGKQIPTFILDADISGIRSAWHAEEIARGMFQRSSTDMITATASKYGG